MEEEKYKKTTMAETIVKGFAKNSLEAGMGATAGYVLAALGVAGVSACFGATVVGDYAIQFVDWLRSLPQEQMVDVATIEGQLASVRAVTGEALEGIGAFARGIVRAASAWGTAKVIGKTSAADFVNSVGATVGGLVGKGVETIKDGMEK